MEQVTAAAAVGRDSDDQQNVHDSSPTTGKKTDQDQKILMATGDTNWYKSTQALKYLQPVFMPIVKDKMKSLQLQSMTDFGRQLCAEATADDIRPVNSRLVKFKHLCPVTLVTCQNLLNIIKENTSDSVNFYQMLKGTDPQQWLNSPFEFVRLFLQDWMRCGIHDFQECDITALCTIVKRCKPLMQIFDEIKIDELRNVRNRTMHPATMSISQEEMENNIDLILDFLEHIKSLKSTDEVTEAIESIKQLRTGDVRLLHSMVVRLIQGWLPGARIVYEHKSEKAKTQLQDVKYMETILERLSSGQDITSLKQSAEQEFEVKKEDKRELEKQNEELIKRLKEDKRELEKQNEELRKLRKEEKRELEKQNEELSIRLNKEKRELEKQNEELRKRLETKKSRSFGKVFPTKEMSTQRSSDGAPEVEVPPKRTASGGQRFPMQALSASTGLGDKGKTVQKEFHASSWLFGSDARRRSGDEHETVMKDFHALSWLFDSDARRRSGDEHETAKEDFHASSRLFGSDVKRRSGEEHETVKEAFSKPEPPYDSPIMTLSALEWLDLGPSPATGCSDVSTIPVESDTDRRPCYITGMVAISGTQLMLADKSNKCIKLLDLERRTVIGVKGFRSAPHDITCVPGSRVAVTIPAFHRIHVFTADKNLKKCGTMSVNGFCFGIHCSGDKFFVSCKDPPLVQIMNMEGDILKTIKLYSVEYPVYLTCSPENNFIYVCDSCNDVSCMVMTGSVQWRYNFRHSKSKVQTLPQGVCTGDGCIYICIFDEIHVVSPTGTKLEVIPFSLKEADNTAVCYSSQKKTLYVSRCPSVDEKNTYISRIRMH